MLPTSEAQRVMEISLGKLANFRCQRVASSLHKNLLVAKVLNQVRNIVSVDESRGLELMQAVPCTNSSSALTSESFVMATKETRDHPTAESEREYVTLRNAEVQPQENHVTCRTRVSDSLLSVPAFASEHQQRNVTISSERLHINDFNEEQQFENVHKITVVPESNRGFKRRPDLGYEDDFDFVTKRRCYHDDDDDDDDCDFIGSSWWRAPPSQLRELEEESPMESDMNDISVSYAHDDSMMDVEQISNLVTVFSTSFKGLGHLESSVDDQVLSPKFSDSICDKLLSKRSTADCKLRRGLSLPDLCAKQADLLCQKFQQNPPIVALTV